MSYSPVVQALLTLTIMKKFDLCYALARKGVAFSFSCTGAISWN